MFIKNKTYIESCIEEFGDVLEYSKTHTFFLLIHITAKFEGFFYLKFLYVESQCMNVDFFLYF